MIATRQREIIIMLNFQYKDNIHTRSWMSSTTRVGGVILREKISFFEVEFLYAGRSGCSDQTLS